MKEVREINVGIVGAGLMAKAHSIALAAMPMLFWPPPFIPKRITLADISNKTAAEAALRFGYVKYTDNWHDIIDDSAIDAVHIVTPPDSHAEIAIAAAKAGKHIMCEKPLARGPEEAMTMYEAVRDAGIVHQIAFNYRKIPAVAQAKKYIIEGAIGKVLRYRGTFLSGDDPALPMRWEFKKAIAGGGILTNLGSHAIDLARYLVGEISEVNGSLRTHVTERPISNGDVSGYKEKVDVDDEANFALRFDSGATGYIEATNSAWGRSTYITFEVYGTEGSLAFNYNRRDELQVCFSKDSAERRGFVTIDMGPKHPYGFGLWQAPQIGVGYSEIKSIEIYDFYNAVAENKQAEPDFWDGYRTSAICAAVMRSAETNLWEKT